MPDIELIFMDACSVLVGFMVNFMVSLCMLIVKV